MNQNIQAVHCLFHRYFSFGVLIPAPHVGFTEIFTYSLAMHEMSLATSLLALIREEMERHGATSLVRVKLRVGTLANVVPESLHMAFNIITINTDLQGASLEIEEEKLCLSCGQCGTKFYPEPSRIAIFSPCPACSEEFGHNILAGKDLYLDRIEVE